MRAGDNFPCMDKWLVAYGHLYKWNSIVITSSTVPDEIQFRYVLRQTNASLLTIILIL